MTIEKNFYVPDFLITVDGAEFHYGLTTDIVSVSITETSNQADSFSITMREYYPNPQLLREGKLSWTDNKAFDEGKEIKIELGYQNNRGIKLKGYITGIGISFTENGSSTMTIRGYNLYHDLQRNRRLRPFDSKTDSGIALEIADALHWSAKVDRTDAEHPLVSPEGATYAAILEERAKRINYEVAVKEETLIFKRPGYLEIPPPSPALELVWGQSLRSFSVDIKSNNMPSSVTVRNTQTCQGGEKKPLVSTVKAEEVSAVLGPTSGLKRAQGVWPENDVLLSDQRVAKPGEAKQVARAEMERRALDYITANGSCMGNPKLVSRTVISLTNLGPRCSGRYYVTSTTHTIDANGYRTDFQAKRDGR